MQQGARPVVGPGGRFRSPKRGCYRRASVNRSAALGVVFLAAFAGCVQKANYGTIEACDEIAKAKEFTDSVAGREGYNLETFLGQAALHMNLAIAAGDDSDHEELPDDLDEMKGKLGTLLQLDPNREAEWKDRLEMGIFRRDPAAQRILEDAAIRMEAAIGPPSRRCDDLRESGRLPSE